MTVRIGGLSLIKYLIRRFITDYENVNDLKVREAYGVLSGVVGIGCNLLLFIVKIMIGFASNSIAVMSDAFNNLSDLGSSIVTILGVKLSNQPPDDNHPYGHGRFEYIATLVVAFVIFAVGVELLKGSVGKIIRPSSVVFNGYALMALLLSVVVKLWMYGYNAFIAKKINSTVVKATAIDSINDAVATFVIIVGLVVGSRVTFPVDGIMGLAISIGIMYAGFKVARDAVIILLGTTPDPELIAKIHYIIKQSKSIKSTHDLKVHDYGPGRIVASIHAEVPDNLDVVTIHRAIDLVEQQIKDELGVDIVVHMDPVSLAGDQCL